MKVQLINETTSGVTSVNGQTGVVVVTATDLGLNVTSLQRTIDGQGFALTTGVKGYFQIPFACTITGWTLLADVSGAVQLDLWKDTYANYPPTIADTITAAAKPKILASGVSATSTTLTGWNTSISAGDIIAVNLDSCTSITLLTFVLALSR